MGEFIIKDINGLVHDQGKIYMISNYIPFIMVYDFEKNKVEKLCDYPRNVAEKAAFERIMKQESKIYLFPCRADSIYCYDMRTQEYTNLLSLHSISEKIPVRKFFEVLTYDGFIYAVCRSPHFVIRINPVNNDVRVWKLEQEILISEGIELVDFSVCVHDNKLVYPYAADILIEFSMYEETFQVIHIEREQDNYDEKYRCLLGMTISDIGRQWVFDVYGNVFEIIDNKMSKIILPPELNGLEETSRIIKLLAHADKLYLFLRSDNRILAYDIQDDSFSWIANGISAWRSAGRRLAYVEHTQVDTDNFLLYNYNDGSIYAWNLKNGFSNQIELRLILNDTSDGELMKDYVMTQRDLELYIQYIKMRSNEKGEENRKGFGQNIYFVLAGESVK